MGLNCTIYALRKQFWVPKHHSLIHNIILNCQTCVLERRGQRLHIPESPPLPEWRFDTANPWRHNNVDMTGHYFVKPDDSAVEQKVYLIIFVCMSTGSGHIEVVHNATSQCFAEAVGRFINRCGAPVFFTVIREAILRDIVRNLEGCLTPRCFKIFARAKVFDGSGLP